MTSCSVETEHIKKTVVKTQLSNWVTGNYTFQSKYGNYFENWKKLDSATYFGLGYFLDIESIDTLFRQRMKLQQTDDGVFMYFNVKNQNNNKDVEFRLTKQENKVYTFENPFRDYPSIVIYKILSDTSINVVMNGFNDGEEKKEDFVLTKKRETILPLSMH